MANQRYPGQGPGSHQTGPLVSKYGFRVGTEDSSTEVIDEDGQFVPAQMNPSFMKVAKVALTAGAADAIAFAWQNPESTAILVHRVIVDVTTDGGTATSVLDIGVVANATATADTIINGLDLDAIAVTDHLLVAGVGVGGAN